MRQSKQDVPEAYGDDVEKICVLFVQDACGCWHIITD